MLIVATRCQLSSTEVDAEFDKLWAVVGRTVVATVSATVLAVEWLALD